MEARYKAGEWVVSATCSPAFYVKRKGSEDMLTNAQYEAISQIKELNEKVGKLDKMLGECQRRELWGMLQGIGECQSVFHEIMLWSAAKVYRAHMFAVTRMVIRAARRAGCESPVPTSQVYGGTAALRPMFMGGNWANNVRELWSEDDACKAARDDSREKVEDAWIRLFGFDKSTLESIESYDAEDCVYELYPWGIVVIYACDGDSVGIVDYRSREEPRVPVTSDDANGANDANDDDAPSYELGDMKPGLAACEAVEDAIDNQPGEE